LRYFSRISGGIWVKKKVISYDSSTGRGLTLLSDSRQMIRQEVTCTDT
jgi:hypothetical protein